MRVLVATALIAAILIAGCGGAAAAPQNTGNKGEPGSKAEQLALGAVEGLAPGASSIVGDLELRAEPAYSSASGRLCRWLLLTPRGRGAARRRLACKDGAAWFYAPDVLAAPVGAP
jgi:hypothetical protein